jgi:oligoendopeptidase F
MVKQIPTRDEVPTELAWDLTTVYASDQDWEADYQAVSTQAQALQSFKGRVTENGEQLLATLESVFATTRRLEKVYVYASMKSDQDTGNQVYAALDARAGALAAEVQEAISFIEPEILAIESDKLDQLVKQTPGLDAYTHYLETLQQKKAHTLPAEQEALLAGASDIFAASQRTFGMLDNADLQFGFVHDEEGNEVQLSNGLYGVLLESVDRNVRQEAFEVLYDTYISFKNTFASTLSSNVKGQNYQARVHHYKSAREAAVSRNNLPESVFETLVENVNANLPLLHDFVALRKEVLGLDEVHTYDLYTPLVGEIDFPVDYESAKALVLEALAPLGKDYTDIVQKAFDEGWIDVIENKGKRSGAYSSGSYDTNPFILLNWQDTLNNVYTLAHELGHSVHSYLTKQNNPYHYGSYPIFLAEIASTTNEMLLTDYLLKTQTDKKVRAYVLNQYLDGFKGTVFRQTQFAEFEHWLHEQDAAGQPLTAEIIADYYAELNQRYYGPALTFDEQIAYEWARIPHFYYNYYVYQYATGEAAATTLAEAMLTQGQSAVTAYKAYLSAGSSDYPLSVIAKAGVDMQASEYLTQAFEVFKTRLAELRELLTQG